MTPFNIPIQEIIANVRCGALHPLDGDGSFSNIEVVLQELVWMSWCLPVELLSDFSPELARVFNRLLILGLVLLQSGYMSLFHQPWIRRKHFILLRGHFHSSVTQSLAQDLNHNVQFRDCPLANRFNLHTALVPLRGFFLSLYTRIME